MKTIFNISYILIVTLFLPLTANAQKMLSNTNELTKKNSFHEPTNSAFFAKQAESIKKMPNVTVKPFIAAPEWKASRGSDLHSVLQQWSTRAGWSLVWNSEYSYTLLADATFKGDYISAVKELFEALDGIHPNIYPELYKGNYVLKVSNKPSL